MSRLVQKSGYIHRGNASGYMRYIATREGVEKISGSGDATKNQRQLIKELLRDFPDSRDLFEYDDYAVNPSFNNASAFITMALDANAHAIQNSDGYMKYIATRPRAERRGEHGLFGSEANVNLQKAMSELTAHDGNVWTIIYSLRREDASRLGYDNAESWRNLLLAHQTEIAEAMKISTGNLRWYAAFHDEGHHPHIHMMVWSEDPKQGYLTRQGIAQMRSKLTNAIFADELKNLYQRKDISYKQLTAAAKENMEQIIRQMEQSVCKSPEVAEKMLELARQLESVTGKKVYGYLKKPVKTLADSIVDELAKLPEVSRFYVVWNQLRDELENYYKTKPREHLPLSQQKEFRVIKNMIISEAENLRLGVFAFDDEQTECENASGQENHLGKSETTQAMLAATRLLRNICGVFRDNSVPPQNPAGIRVESKRRKKLMEKRVAMGHKPDDYENQQLS